MVLDGNRMTNPSLEGEVAAMRKALADAGVTVAELDYVNAQGRRLSSSGRRGLDVSS